MLVKDQVHSSSLRVSQQFSNLIFLHWSETGQTTTVKLFEIRLLLSLQISQNSVVEKKHQLHKQSGREITDRDIIRQRRFCFSSLGVYWRL